jgi:Fic family protein
MKKPYFTISEICSVFNLKTTTARTYISQMEKLGIISPDASGGDDTIYRTVDPRICYLMSRGISNLR